MPMTREELLDRLRRAYEMEEVMVPALVGLIDGHTLYEGIPSEKKTKVLGTISILKKDTLEHRKIIADLIQRISEETYEF